MTEGGVEMINYSIPIIEQFANGFLMDEHRKDTADAICHYLTSVYTYDQEKELLRSEYYMAAESLLKSNDSIRILLYLPFPELNNAPESFKRAYLNAWYRLLSVQDVRENFHEGDTFELDARPNGEVERVVKCAHLTPWLIAAGYINCDELLDILNYNRDNEVLLRSFKETWRYVQDNKLLPEAEVNRLYAATSSVASREKLQPLYVSKKRIEWLNERQNRPSQLLTPNAHLEGPFSPNLETMLEEIEEIEANLEPNEIVLVGGSQLKGYGTIDSDLDIWNLKELERDPVFYPGSPHSVHIYFNTVWVGGREVKNLAEISREKASIYSGSRCRRMSLERLESDLLQYRLLHKGFARREGAEYSMKKYPELDGDCPFYDYRYRIIATMLYAKYVFVPS